MVLPTVTLFKKLLKTLFGRHTSYPYFTTGPISTRFMREIDEKRQRRPVELIHPDIKLSSVIHGTYVHDFLRMWHDAIFHCMRNSINENKEIFRYLRKLFAKVTKHEMSKIIWYMTDMDSPTNFPSLKIKEMQAKGNQVEEKKYEAELFQVLFENMIPNFWNNPYHPCAVIIYIDMVLNSEEWKYYYGNSPEKHSSECKKLLPNFDDSVFQQQYAYTKLITQQYPDKNIEFYVLLLYFSRNGVRFTNAMLEVCLLIERFQLYDILFVWGKDNGLLFRPNMDIKERAIEKLDPDTLFKNIHTALSQIQTRKLSPRVSDKLKLEMLDTKYFEPKKISYQMTLPPSGSHESYLKYIEEKGIITRTASALLNETLNICLILYKEKFQVAYNYHDEIKTLHGLYMLISNFNHRELTDTFLELTFLKLESLGCLEHDVKAEKEICSRLSSNLRSQYPQVVFDNEPSEDGSYKKLYADLMDVFSYLTLRFNSIFRLSWSEKPQQPKHSFSKDVISIIESYSDNFLPKYRMHLHTTPLTANNLKGLNFFEKRIQQEQLEKSNDSIGTRLLNFLPRR